MYEKEKDGEEYKYMLDHVNCRGDEKSLFACQYLWLGEAKCDKKMRAGVKCEGMSCFIH